MIKYQLIIIFIFLFKAIIAQKYNFKNFSIEDGVTQSEILAICEDDRGYLWFGTNGGGLLKFNGYEFSSYTEDDGLLNNFVLSIFEDKNGILWIGTIKGLCIYNGFKFSTISDTIGPANKVVRSIIQDHSGTLWFGTEGDGLYMMDSLGFSKYNKSKDLQAKIIYSVFEDSFYNLWIGTEKGVYKLNDSIILYLNRYDGLGSNIIRGICEDDNANLWFATYGGGVAKYNCDTIINYTVYEGLSNNTVFSAFHDKNGNLWFGTAHGVSRFDGNQFKNYYENTGLAGNVVMYILKDFSNGLWFGTSGGGISKFDNERFIHYPENHYLGRMIYTINQSPSGEILFGTSKGGLTIFDGRNYRLIKYFTTSMVRSLYYSPDTTLWIGTIDDGAYRYKNRFTHFSHSEGIHSNRISGFATDIHNNTWIASLDSGVCIVPYDTSNIGFLNQNHGLSSNSLLSIAADVFGNIWIGTTNKGLNKVEYDKKDTSSLIISQFNTENGLTNNTIRSIIVDSVGNIYMATAGGGLNIYDGKNFYAVTKKEGLSSNNLYLLIFDKKNNLWAGSEKGVDKITFGKDFFVEGCIHYGKNEGFSGIELYRNSCHLDKNGNIWFGTINGATMYNAKEDKSYNYTPKIQITGIKLFFEDITNMDYMDSLSSWNPLPINLNLPYNKNHLTFEFLGIYQRNPEAVRYKVILEGIDDDWSGVIDRREVTYSNLPPGEYTFKVLACNEHKSWNEQPAQYSFTILPPIWQKWWFRIAIGLSLLLIVVWIIYSRFKNIKTKNKIIQDKLEMEKNVIELEQEAARLQMNPHFIFNSLNSIQGFIATNDTFQAKRYLAKFARLMRLILENSREEFIPLQNEIDILDNYLDLEKLSTNNKFDFNINIEESIDTEAIEISPMMIQPFVENAIVHGIKKKEGKGNISIKFRPHNNLIVCEVVDDGIGRDAANKSSDQSKSKHRSTGINVTKKRLEQMKHRFKANAGVKIIDLKDEHEKSLGTKVIISIPYEIY